MAKKHIHVVWSTDDKNWQIKKEGNKNALATTKTKKEALEVGKEFAKLNKVELVIHNKDGKISDKDSYGNESKVKDTVN